MFSSLNGSMISLHVDAFLQNKTLVNISIYKIKHAALREMLKSGVPVFKIISIYNVILVKK